MQTTNRLLGLITLCLGVALFMATFGIEEPPGTEESLSPRFFPQLLSIVLTILGAALSLQSGGESLQSAWKTLSSGRSVALVLLVALYTLGFGYMDFRLGTWLFVFAGMWVMGSRNKLELLIAPFAVSLLVYALFRYGFMILLPVWG